MTVSLLRALAVLPDGEQSTPLSMDELGQFLRDKLKLNGDDEKQRNERHALRDRLHCDGGHADMRRLLFEMFESPIAEKLAKRIPIANFSNALKRIVGELSTVYARPARRVVDGAQDQNTLDRVVKALNLDAQLAYANRMLNLHRALLVGPRVRKNPDGTRTLVLDIATPAVVRAIPNPLDTTQILAWLIRVDMPMHRTPDSYRGKVPAWALWSDHERGYLDDSLTPIPASWTEHRLGLNRWVPLTYSANAIPRFWPGREGEDLVAADQMMWLAAILMVKETQATTKVPVAQGDMSMAARGQAAESDGMVALPEGASITTIEIGTDPDVFIKASDHALERTGNNYGLSMGAITHQGTQSAEARDLLLAPVRERREIQRHIFRLFEARLVEVIAAVCRVDLPELAFDPTGFRVNFAETQTLLPEDKRLAVFETKRRLGLISTPEHMMDEDPDLTDEQAWSLMAQRIDAETRRNILMRPLQEISGSLGADHPAPDMPGTNPQHGEAQGPVALRGDSLPHEAAAAA